MRYYKRLNHGKATIKQPWEIGVIYPENSQPDIQFVTTSDSVYLSSDRWEEVSEREYWQQELDAGKLVKGGYYVVLDYGNIFKYDQNNNAEYYTGESCSKFKRNGGGFYLDDISYRLATEDEIEYLEACNKADKFISNEEFMKNKKVEYYKLTKPEFTKAAEVIMQVPFGYEKGVGIVKVPDCIRKLEKAEVLDKWFEPVYAPELKVGDWVIVTKEVNGNSAKVGHICQLVKIDDSVTPYEVQDTYKNYNWCVRTSWVTDVRLATPEEIKKATVIKIKGYEAKIDAQGGKVNIGCKSFTYGNVRGVVAAIEAGLNVEDADQILKLWDKIK